MDKNLNTIGMISIKWILEKIGGDKRHGVYQMAVSCLLLLRLHVKSIIMVNLN